MHIFLTQKQRKVLPLENQWWCSGSSKEKKMQKAKQKLMWICKLQQEPYFFPRWS
jgi:hypothetical protein